MGPRYNVQGPINIWVTSSWNGAFPCPLTAAACRLRANGLASAMPGANIRWGPTSETSQTGQVVFINYERCAVQGANAVLGGPCFAAGNLSPLPTGSLGSSTDRVGLMWPCGPEQRPCRRLGDLLPIRGLIVRFRAQILGCRVNAQVLTGDQCPPL